MSSDQPEAEGPAVAPAAEPAAEPAAKPALAADPAPEAPAPVPAPAVEEAPVAVAVAEAVEAAPPADEDPSRPVDAVIDAVTATQQETMQTMEAARTSMVEGLAKARREAADFVSERIRQDMETQKALLRCKTFQEVRTVQAAFFRTAVDQYSAEATRLMKLGSAMVSRASHRG